MSLVASQLNGSLTELGFPAATTTTLPQIVRAFQAAWLLGPLLGLAALVVDGNPGPRTQQALAASLKRARGGLGSASEHFSYAECACHCGGKYPGCRVIVVAPELLIGLERLRGAFYAAAGLTPGSVYRCAAHNAAEGGKGDSMHLRGAAADIPMSNPRASTAAVAKLRTFSGIGYQASTGLVRHVDTRGQGATPSYTPAATAARPQTWVYLQ